MLKNVRILSIRRKKIFFFTLNMVFLFSCSSFAVEWIIDYLFESSSYSLNYTNIGLFFGAVFALLNIALFVYISRLNRAILGINKHVCELQNFQFSKSKFFFPRNVLTLSSNVNSLIKNLKKRVKKENEFKLIVNCYFSAVVLMESDFKIKYTNTQFLNYSIAFLQKESESKFLYDLISAEVWEKLNTCIEKKPNDIEISFEFSYKKSLYKYTLIRHFNGSGDVEEMLLYIEDISLIYELKLALDLKTSQNRTLEDRIEEVKTRQANLFKEMSHIFRTSIHGIEGMSDALVRNGLTPKQAKCVDMIKKCSHSLVKIVNEISYFVSVGDKKPKESVIGFNLQEAIRQIVEVLELSSKKNGLGFKLIYDASLPEYVVGDLYRIKYVFRMLLTAYSSFVQSGQCRIFVYRSELSKSDNVVCCVSIKYEGEKLEEGSQRSYFAQTRLDSVRRSLEAMSGFVSFEDMKSSYNRIAFSFSVKVDSNKGNKSKSVSSTASRAVLSCLDTPLKVEKVETATKEYSDARVLVAEDSFANQEIIKEMLDEIDVPYEIVENGEEAINAFMEGNVENSGSRPYELILMDCNMPIVNGIEATEQIRKIEREKGLTSIPIIACTANETVTEEGEYLSMGMDGCIKKPFSIENIENVFRKWIKNKNFK